MAVNNRDVIMLNMKRKSSADPIRATAKQDKTSENWFKGSQPTEAETLAQIYRVAQQDQARGEQALSLYNKAKSEGAWNEPYSKPTTQYGELVGIDPITLNDDNIKSLVPYLQGGVLTSTGSLSSAKKNGTDAQYAYNLSGLMQDYESTKAYLAEQDEIVREAQYWIRKGLSDDEIKAKLNIGGGGTKYTKIKNAIDKAKVGEVVRTTSPLWAATSYGIDSMLWGLRNPDQTTGDTFYDAVQMELGRGNAYVRDEERMSRLDAASENYNPYMVGTTMDDLAIKYGVDQFDDQWLQQNRGMRNDPKLAGDYSRIYNAHENTLVLQQEADAFRSALAEYAERGVQPDYGDLFEEGHRGVKFDNLKKLVESLKSGKLYDTTAAIDFDLKALMAETDAAVKLKQAQTKAATDLEAAEELAGAEKQSWWQKKLEDAESWWQNLTTPEETIAPPTPIIEETPAEIVSEGEAVFEPVVAQHVAEGDYNTAADEAMQEYAALLEQNPELLTTDDMQKGALFLLVAANEAGWLTDPAAQEKANSVMATVEASMGIESEAAETKTVWSVLYNLLTGGELGKAQANEGIGLNATLMLLWDRAMARGADIVDNAVGAAISGLGELLNNEWLINYGKESMAHNDEVVAHYDQYLNDHGTPLENIAAKSGSEVVHMAQLGSLSKIASTYKTVKAGKGAEFLTKVLMASPFALEAGGAEFQETYAETDNYTMGLAAGAAATAITSLLSQWDGILRNIEANGMPYLPAVVEALGSVPGSGVKAGIARWGKAFGMWMLNGLKTIANEGVQEAVEGGATDIVVSLIKGKNLSDVDWAQFGKDRAADAIGAVVLSLGSAVSTMPAYARSVKVYESQALKSELTAKDVDTFVSAVQADMQDPEIVRDMQERALNIAVETRTGELIAEGAMDGLDHSAVEAAQTKLADTEAALAEANTAFNANPADDAAKNEVLRLIKERDAARAEAEKVQADYDAAAAELMNTVREQARAEVTQNMAAVQEARMQQEAAAEVQRQNDNVLALEADNFIETYFSDAPDEQKQILRERYMSYDGPTQNATRGMVEFASQISKKFGLSVKFTDSHGIFEGAYTGGNQIVLDKNATQGDVIKRVLVHEITHAAETSKNYDALADAVLEAYYGDNQNQIKVDIAEKAKRYAKVAGQDGEAVARAELVADRLAEMLSGDQKALDRLVAEKPDVATRIWRAIKEFIGKLTGVKNSELDKYIQLEKKLEKGLRSRGSEKNKTAFSIAQTEDGTKYVVVDTDQNIFDGKDVSSFPKIAREYIKERFRGTVIGEGDNRAYVDAKTGQEYTNPANRRMPQDVFSAKMKTATELDNLLKASVVEGHNPPTDRHPEFPGGFDLYETIFSVSGQMFSGRMNIGVDANNRRRLYDLTQIKSLDSGSWIKQHGGAAVQTSSQDFSADSLTQEPAKVNLSIPSKSGEPVAEIIKGGATKFSLTSWNENEKAEVRKSLIQNGFGPANVDKWMDDVNGVAAIIAADKGRLDYKAADNQVMLKNNQEYVKTLDASTLCAKRLLYQGTFNEIQHMLPNTVLTSEDLLHLSDMMNQAGLETPCGVCYVESRRRHLGKFAQEWLDSYSGGYKPTLDEVTTTDGLEALRINHPETYRSFVDTMNSKGSANPKVVQLRTDYRGDIRKLTKGETKKIVKIGGLRIQSFSDFETPHLIDMMQAVLDMSSRKLPAQAYTKVPNFAWVFGDTGIKINLSLLAEGNGLNVDGTLRFSSKEGMDIDEAMRLRERYSENVGTILVGVSEGHIRAAMADPRIDYIIPFHKSGWGQNELNLLPVLNSYDNFEDYQNERTIVGYRKNGKPKYGKPKGGNFYPIDYWDYSKTGDENAATYLRMCEEDGRVPKFEQFLEKDADGHWAAPSGYWKMLIDFKMYDNDGNGSPQKAVLPIFNMEEAARVLNEYEGGADTLPVAYDIADRFVSEKKASNPSVKFSLPKTETEVRDKTYLKAVEEGDTDTARRMVEQKAQEEGFANAVPEQTLAYSVRKGAPPKKTIKVYKVFTVSPDGKPTALFVSGTEELPQNVWLDAQDTWHFTAKNGHEYVPSTQNPYTDGGKTGAQVEVPNEEIRSELIKRGFLPAGSKAKAVTALAYRPGWHAGDLPFFPQGGMKREGSNYENIHRYNQVVFECEFDADHDYTEEALNQEKAKTKKGTINYRNADLQYMPTGGFYKYATNPLTMQGGHGAWFIGGSLKIGRALTQKECDAILDQHGFLPQEWEQGELDLNALGYTGEQFDAAKKTLAPITYDDNGGVIPLSKRFDKSVNDIRFSLPSNDILDQRIAQYRNGQLAPAPNDIIPNGGEPAQNYGDGERQFAEQTIQNSTVVPDWIKQEFLRPEELNYEVDTNREQVERSWQRIQENGYEAERDRLLSLDRYSADDTAEANLMMAMALREDTADPATFMALASHYNKEGTKAGQELQARKLFTRMSPTGARVWAAGQMESNLEEHMRTHQPQRRRVDENARQVADQIRGLQGGDEILRLNAGGDFTIDESNNRWGIPINEQQQALIDHYGLNNVGRPGIFYNRATTRQRMLEAILATPNPLEVTGLGLNLIQRLEFMRDGESVITNADLNYIGTQLGQFVALGEEAGGRAADLALARAYEAFGNITPATRMEQFRTQRYVNMLSTFTSFARNIIGNVGQNVANAAAHGIAVEIDRLTSLGTGRRTMAHLSTAERIEGWRAFAEETRNTFLDFFVDRANTAPNRDRYSTNQRGRVFQNGALEMSKDIESFLMSVGDRNIWRKAFVNSLAEQQKLADRNQLFNDDGTTRTHEQMVEHAEAAANYATFTEDSLAQDIMQFIRQRSPVAADVLGLYMPFTGVPHNIMKRNFQYSPIGFLTMAGRMAANRINGRNFDQNAFVNDLSRALTGTGGVLMGVVLGLAGAIKMGTEDEQKDKVYDVETALGEQYTPYVYDPTTDTYVSMSTFAPAASPLVWGAAIGQQLKNDEFNSSVLLSALGSSVDSIFDASYLSGLSDLFGGYGSFTENLAHVTAENLSSQLTPAFFNQVANAMDPYVRDTKDKDYLTELMKTTLNRIPILRNKLLPEKVTVAGENVMTKQGWSLVDPFTRTNPSDNAALIEVKRLYDVVGDTAVLPSDALRSRKNSLTLNKKSVTLNDQQKAEYKKYYGDLWTSEVSALMATPAYQLMDDEERAAKVEKIMADALKRAKKEFIERYGE